MLEIEHVIVLFLYFVVELIEVLMMNKDILNKFLEFVQKCNTEAMNSNDYNIIQCVFQHIGKETFPSSNQLAEEANISKASLSRFIRKYNFESYQQFRNLLSMQTTLLGYNLKLMLSKDILSKDDQEISDLLYQQCMNNLKATKENLNLDLLVQMVKSFKESEDITFIGDEHDLDEFLLLQLHLLTQGKCAYLFKINEIKKIRNYFFNKHSVVVIVNVSKGFFHYQEALEHAYQQGAKIIYISQDECGAIKEKVDIYYKYGIDNSLNTGYVSLYYLGELLEKLCIKYF